MRFNRLLTRIILLALGVGIFTPPHTVRANAIHAPAAQVSAFELILAMNTLRVSYGLPALIEDPIINAVAQSTAQTMAANNMSWHIGDVRGRIAAAGYGGGGTVWATENFAVSWNGGMGIDEIMAVWADPDHMRPAVTPEYCHVGAGVATVNGKTYFILQAAYVSGQACGSTTSSSPSGGTPGTSTVPNPVSQLILPVKIATPDADGKIFHVVQAGQSFWAIAVAYQVTIQDIETWNNITRDTPLQSGQRLFIPNKNTAGFATPTPRGMVVTQTPDADGKIVHVVQPYQSLFTIGEAYRVSVDRILQLNGLQADVPLQIEQKLVISPGNVTPSPTLSAIQKLTPDASGNYYHVVQSGETLSGIANLYDVPLADLMNWNELGAASVIIPNQKLLLRVTPPATATSTLAPATVTLAPSPSVTSAPPTEIAATEVVPVEESTGGSGLGIVLVLGIILVGGLLWWRFGRKN
ncbi:MAG: LysM peptidoglycan-binding domain-containing protein [Anaerolineae bacterium]|nr:LysM peptidoglycan-binding domain-containing protein [Anaerolineae bacterium]MBL8107527.1 LysM peptidoglycan-binding domain-containing protein [Anaerolineales bacterium]MCC7190411.1 LysM peptidoglycan-binding domain-containing protein [Anaerolineales bacterium]